MSSLDQISHWFVMTQLVFILSAQYPQSSLRSFSMQRCPIQFLPMDHRSKSIGTGRTLNRKAFPLRSFRIQASLTEINQLDEGKFRKLLQRIADKAGRQVREDFVSLSLRFQ